MEGNGLKIIGRKQAQTNNKIVEVIYRRGEKTSINLMKGHRSNCKGVQGLRGGVIIPHYFFNNGEVRYTQDQQRGEHCIHDPIHLETDPKDETGVVGMKTESNIYIHFAHFSSLSHSTTMTYRHGN